MSPEQDSENKKIALMMLRAFVLGNDYNGEVMITIRHWIDRGMEGPVPWPGGALFDVWAATSGLFNSAGFVKFLPAKA